MVRAVIGTCLLLIGLPLLLAGGALWFAMQHQDPAGGYSARLTTISSDGYAVVASDVDALLRREAPFTRSGQTTLRLTARTATGPAFVGLAPPADVARYLASVPHTRVDQVRLARGPLPVVTTPVAGVAVPAAGPDAQPFWRTSSHTGALEWSPSELRGEQLALVVMDPHAAAPVRVDLAARVQPQWLGSTTLGLLVLGTVLLLVAVVALAWPTRPREIVYVVPPAQLPEIAAHLGVPVPRAAAGEPVDLAGSLAGPVPAGFSATGTAPACAPAAAGPPSVLPPPVESAEPPTSSPAESASLPGSIPDPAPPAPAAPEPRAPEAPHPPAPVAGKTFEWPPPHTAHPPTASPTPVPVPASAPGARPDA
ncbi:MAG: hypothetical protein GEV12_19260 [Micromonosporaceae bacterium]|nr:hypothetical protein [Micromonosporaceae bacterium]